MITSTYSYSLKKPLMKVHRCLPAKDSSIVLIYLASLGKDAIMHINSKNQQVFNHAFDDMVDTLTMPNDHEAVVLLVSKNKIFVVDLLTHAVRLYNYQYMIDISCQVKLEAFYQTKMICIFENGTYNHHVLRISYFHFPFKDVGTSNEVKSCAVFEAQEGDWTYEYTIRKGNSHSMILWYRSRHDDQFQIKTFDLRSDPKGVFRVLKIKNTLGDPYGIEKINCAVQEVWEMKPNVFCIVATTDKTEKKCINTRQNVINNFIWEVDSGTIREARFQLPPKANPLQIDNFSCGQYSMFRSFAFEHGNPIDSPAIYVNNASEVIQATESSRCTFQSYWQTPGYSDCLFAEGVYDNCGVGDISIKTRLFLSRKVMSCHLLMQSQYKCLDQGLMGEIIGLIDYQS